MYWKQNKREMAHALIKRKKKERKILSKLTLDLVSNFSSIVNETVNRPNIAEGNLMMYIEALRIYAKQIIRHTCTQIRNNVDSLKLKAA